MEPRWEGLVMGLGVSEGNDTAFYLFKGFRVLGVEADPGMCERLRVRFQAEIASGVVTVLNNAVGRGYGGTVDISGTSTASASPGCSTP